MDLSREGRCQLLLSQLGNPNNCKPNVKNLPMGRERGGCAVCGPPLRWAGDGDWSGCCCGCWMGGGAWVTLDLVLSDSGAMVKS